MQALNASNEQFDLLLWSEKTYNEDLPMLHEKKTSELIETSLIYLLSAAVAAGAFVLVGLIALLFGFSQT